MRRSKLWLLLVAVLLVVAACADDRADDVADAPDDQDEPDLDQDEPEEDEAAEEADDGPPPWPWEAAADGEDVEQAVPLEEIRSGGPPPDGIPPIDDPQFESVDEAAEWLSPGDPIMIAERDGEARAYPLAILTYHEIVNDEIGGEPTLVTYCPLCNSGLVFDSRVDGEVLSFGTSGRLWKSNLVMYDRGTRSLWSQFTGEAIVGERTGEELERLPMQIVSLEEVAEQWPDAPVLSRDTGHTRPYGENPYVGYEEGDPFLFDGDTQGPLAQMDRVVAAGGDADPVAYPWERLEDERVVHDDIDGEPVVVLWAPGTASALDTREISDGMDVGQAGLFSAEVDGEPRTFLPGDDDRFVDEETGTVWNILGKAIEGPDEGAELERLEHDDTFWFVQHAFRPETRVEDG